MGRGGVRHEHGRPDRRPAVGVIEEFNRTDHDFPADPCLPDLLREQARLRPDDAAVLYGDERLSFGELLAGTTDVAAYLRHLGVAPDDCVGLFVEPSADLMLGAWGILPAGGAYLPLSPEYPAERLRYVIADPGAKVVFAQPSSPTARTTSRPSTACPAASAARTGSTTRTSSPGRSRPTGRSATTPDRL